MRRKTSAWGSQMPLLRGGAEVWQHRGQSVMWTYAGWAFIVAGFISSAGPPRLQDPLLWGDAAQRPRLKTEILLQDPVISQHGSAATLLAFHLHADQWQDHSGLITGCYPSVCVCVCVWFVHIHTRCLFTLCVLWVCSLSNSFRHNKLCTIQCPREENQIGK